MKNLQLITASLLAVTATGATAAKKEASQQRPNVLFMMTDEQRADAIALAGKFPMLKTPNLDRLAKSGAYFTKAYTAMAVSAPARASLLTGLLVEHHGVTDNEVIYTADPAANGLAMVDIYDGTLNKEGYYVEYHGKYHDPIAWAWPYTGFKYTVNKTNRYTIQDMLDYRALVAKVLGTDKPVAGEGQYIDKSFNAPYIPNPLDRREYEKANNLPPSAVYGQGDSHGRLLLPDDASQTKFHADNTIAALNKAKKSGKPWSITCSINMPHPPMLPVSTYYDMYKVADMPVPVSIDDPMVDSPYINANKRKELTQYADKNLIKYMVSEYLGLVTEVDKYIGEILDVLEKNGQLDNTLIIFTSDHGEMLGSHGMSSKNVFYEEAECVPLMISFKGHIKPGTVVDNYVTTLDLYATILDYLGVKSPDQRDSHSLRGKIEGTDNSKNMVVAEWFANVDRTPSHMIVEDNWKLFFNYDNDNTKVPKVLYNLKDDPYEMKNLIGKSNPDRAKYFAKANELKNDMAQWLRERNSKYADRIDKLEIK